MTTTSQVIKAAVADAVFGDLEDALKEEFVASGVGMLSGAAVEVHHVSDLQRQVRVKTQNNGTHYFIVRVSEQM